MTVLSGGFATALIVACSGTDQDNHGNGAVARPTLTGVAPAMTAPVACACAVIDDAWKNDPNDPAPNCAPGLCLMGTNVPGARAWACVDKGCGGDSGLPPPPPPPPPPFDAGTCTEPPVYPPSNNTSLNLAFSFDLPDPAAAYICGQLSLIPYIGQTLFTPGGGIGFDATFQTTTTDEWSDTCVHTTGKSCGAGVKINICSLEAEGSFNDDKKNTDYGCSNCSPPPATCSGVGCKQEREVFTGNASLSKTFSLPMGGVCTEGTASCQWLDWLKQHLNLSVTVGGGWNGNKTITKREPGGAADCPTCEKCEEEDVNNQVYVQASGRASLSTPSWGGVSGSVYAQLIGRLGAGRQDKKSTCAPTCGGYNANAQVTLCMGYSATAWFWTVGSWIGYTCKWSKSWSDCPGANAQNDDGCRMANPTDGCGQ